MGVWCDEACRTASPARGPATHLTILLQWIEQGTRNELEIVDSALYKALHRLVAPRNPERRPGVPEEEAGRGSGLARYCH